MIPLSDIRSWGNVVPWINDEQVEQDLVISRSLIEIFSNEVLSANLAFRGGTALHKLYLNPQPRYSENIDLVQKVAGPIKDIFNNLRNVLSFIGDPSVTQKNRNNTSIYRFDSDNTTPVPMRMNYPGVEPRGIKTISIVLQIFSHRSSLGLQHTV